MPADDGLGLHDDQDIGPAGPEPAQGRPEESVQVAQGRPRPSAFQYRDLLSKGKDFEGSVASTAEEDPDGGQKSKDESGHKPYVVACVTSSTEGLSQEVASC